MKYFYSDIDNTLNLKKSGIEVIDEKICTNILALIKTGQITFGVNTTRGFLRAKEAIGNIPTLPYIVLNGGQVFNVDNTPLFSFPLTQKEKVKSIDLIHKNMANIRFIATYPVLGNTSLIYISDEKEVGKFAKKYSSSISKITSDFNEYINMLETNTYCMIEIKSTESIEKPTVINLVFDGLYYINKSNVNKIETMMYVLKYLKVSKEDLFFAGDSKTDFISATYTYDLKTICVGAAYKSTYTCHDPNELIKLVEKLV